jgi:hypothetical protein
MDKKIQAKICVNCNGNGKQIDGNSCPECRGIGFIGTDGVNEYYLSNDGKGNLAVIDSKPPQSSNNIDKSNITVARQKKSIIRSLFFIILIISYLSFIGIYMTLINNLKVFWVVSIIFAGLITIYILNDTRILDIIINKITQNLLKEPDDFSKFVKNQTKNQEPV